MYRRQYLAVAAGAAAAGCLGGDGGGGTATPEPSLSAPVLGDPDAAVTVASYEDFACPHCRTYALDVFPRIREEYVAPGKVRYEHHDFPIPVDERWSWDAALAARAVQDAVGDEAFFEYATRLFENQGQYSMDLIGRLADAVGADADAVRQAVREERFRPTVAADRRRGRDAGVSGTPTVFVDGEALSSYGYRTVADAIESAL
ncbi:MAG: thioredoxin domain-containing protein [Haloferacaceae archaeon]